MPGYNLGMLNWSFPADSAWSAVLAADARVPLSEDPGPYQGDLIWELSLAGKEPAALTVHSTLGLRAVSAAFFPVFHRLGINRIDPSDFTSPPRLNQFLPSWIMVHCQPFDGLLTQLEYRAVGAHLLAGRIRIANKTVLPQYLRLDWAGVVNPRDGGDGLAVTPQGLGHALTASSGGLELVACITGSAQPGKLPWPSLSVTDELYPGSELSLFWAVAGLPSREDAFRLAQLGLNRPWEAELARLELTSASEDLIVQTGNQQWDAVLALAQKTAHDLILPTGGSLPQPVPVLARQPDLGAVSRGDGSDFPNQWRGATALDCLTLAGSLLPGSAELVKGWVENFLHTLNLEGQADLRPAPGGQRARLRSQPLLALLAEKASAADVDSAWLQTVYPALKQAFRAWVGEIENPMRLTWQSPQQTQLDDHPLFDRWSPQSAGMDIKWLVSPALGSMLYQESRALVRLARKLGTAEDIPWLEKRADQIRAMVEACWDRRQSAYTWHDRETMLTPTTHALARGASAQHLDRTRKLRQPQRLILQLELQGEGTRAVQAVLRGLDREGKPVEDIFQPRDFSWAPSLARATTLHCYLEVRSLELTGLAADEQWQLIAPGLNRLDISLFLPLWAGIPDAKRAEKLINILCAEPWLRPAGLVTYPEAGPAGESMVELPWNFLIIEGLLKYGRRADAAGILGSALDAVAGNLRVLHQFRRVYDARTGLGRGEKNHLWGLPAVGLLLKVAGIEVRSSREVILQPDFPFDQSITVQYKRVQITRSREKAVVKFPGYPLQEITVLEPVRVTIPD